MSLAVTTKTAGSTLHARPAIKGAGAEADGGGTAPRIGPSEGAARPGHHSLNGFDRNRDEHRMIPAYTARKGTGARLGMGGKSPAPISPREAGHRSRDTMEAAQYVRPLPRIIQVECVRDTENGIDKRNYPFMRSRNAFRLNDPSMGTGGAREAEEAEETP